MLIEYYKNVMSHFDEPEYLCLIFIKTYFRLTALILDTLKVLVLTIQRQMSSRISLFEDFYSDLRNGASESPSVTSGSWAWDFHRFWLVLWQRDCTNMGFLINFRWSEKEESCSYVTKKLSLHQTREISSQKIDFYTMGVAML